MRDWIESVPTSVGFSDWAQLAQAVLMYERTHKTSRAGLAYRGFHGATAVFGKAAHMEYTEFGMAVRLGRYGLCGVGHAAVDVHSWHKIGHGAVFC